MEKILMFKDEINYIKDERLREDVKKLLLLVPDYFFSVPASSTGKYHPSFSSGERGLVRHTKVAMRIAKDILDIEYMSNGFSNREKDLILIAILFHDSHKLGNSHEKYTRFDHPLLAGEFIKNNSSKLSLSDFEIDLVSKMICAHMGQWNTNQYSDVVLPKPRNKYEFFVHMCDFLSSKKYLDVKFDERDCIL